jgi:hypothetical protein
MQAAFLNTLIKADTTILRTFIWHSSHLRFVFWSGQESRVCDRGHRIALFEGDAEKRQLDLTGDASGPTAQHISRPPLSESAENCG